ncbi:Hpt domain-containing protein [Geodermatophilus dictyosporus]|uniref:Hpt domain-containing protein n=1 Tax=Geodermatophilus dictyosporus TaxID=1523247 RepID=A0A1I5N996_9ACTN|nr:response regulator [Geodermatophilus dictyosporus]SFP18303.1 Hpt domain-containing protein [Geodermatophilus dictyosporus]
MARVLVVEDEDTTRLLLEARLRWAGHRVRAVASAPEARAVIEHAFTPEVVVTDMFMPGGSGLGLVSDLRADPGSATVPVVFLSGRALPGDVAAGRALGAAYLHKPCTVGELTAAIDEVLGAPETALEGVVRQRVGDLGAVDGDEERDLVATLLEVFVEQAPAAVAAIESAAAAGDVALFGRAAHRLRGAAANLGAEPLARACAGWDDAAAEGTLPDPAEVSAVLAREVPATCAVFAALAAELRHGPPEDADPGD